MWFLGLIVGAIIGAIGDGTGALAGGVVGLVVGLALTRRAPAVDDKWKQDIEDTLRQLQQRLGSLEKGGSAAAAAQSTGTPATRPPAPAELPIDAAAVVDRRVAAMSAAVGNEPVSGAPAAAPAAESGLAAALAREGVDPSLAMPHEPPVSQHSSGVSNSLAASHRKNAVRNQWIGVIVGAVLGLSAGAELGLAAGFGGVLVGGFLGWVLAMILTAYFQESAAPQVKPARDNASQPADEEPLPYSARPAPAPAPVPAVAAEAPMEPPVAAPTAPEPEAPGVPGWWQRVVSGNIVAKVGVVVLFFGVGFLLKYAYDLGMLPVQLRLAGVAVFGAAMLVVGWRLTDARRLYGLILQGGAIGLLYLDVYFALRIYDLLGMTVGFTAFMLLGVAATLLAVRQDAKVLAVLGLTGAFLAPILASAQTGNHVLLFSYYTLLNGFILTISWFKAWRDLNLVGFFFTFIVGLLWGANNYQPELFATVEPFVLIFFAMYLVIPILFSQRQPPELKGLVDGALVFGTPIAAAFMQAGLVKDMPYGLAWSAGCASALYALLAATTVRRDRMRVLGETYIALSIVFLTLAIFFAFDAYPTFALWTLEGAAVIWVGLRQRRLLARLFGLALQLAGAIYFLIQYPDYRLANPWFNDFVVGCVIIAASGFIIAWLMHRYRDALVKSVEPPGGALLAWGGLWWAIAGTHSLYHAYPWATFLIALLAFTAATFAIAEILGSWMQWPDLRRLSHAHLPALVAVAAVLFMTGEPSARGGFGRPLAHGGYWAWPANFLVLLWASQRQLRAGILPADSVRQGLTWWLIAALATWDASWLLAHRDYWGVLAWGAAGMAVATARFWWRERGFQAAAGYSAWILLWGVVWWFVGGAGLVDRHVEPALLTSFHLGFAALTFLAAEWVGRSIAWQAARVIPVAHVPVMIGILILTAEPAAQPLGGGRLIAWPASFAVLYWTLHRQWKDGVAVAHQARYVAGWLLIAVVATWEVLWELSYRHYAWALGWSALGMLAGYARYRLRERDAARALPISTLVLAWGMGFWYVSGFAWIDSDLAAIWKVAAGLGFIAASCTVFETAGSVGDWLLLRRTVIVLPLTMAGAALLQFADGSHPFAAYGWLAWPAAFLALYAALWRQERAGNVVLGNVQHVLALWLAILLLAWELMWQADSAGFGRAWARAAWGAVPALALIWAGFGRPSWPFGVHYASLYRGVALPPVALTIVFWTFYANAVHPGSMAPLPYLPMANPLDIAQSAVLFALWRWWGTFDADSGPARSARGPSIAALAFLWVNCIVLRSIHFWAGVEYRFDALISSVLVQSAFSLLWTTTALLLMLHATRNARRRNWIVGAALLAVVVVKLFLLDLANSGTVERIVSFIGVGIGLLAIGYFAPVPPGEKEQQDL